MSRQIYEAALTAIFKGNMMKTREIVAMLFALAVVTSSLYLIALSSGSKNIQHEASIKTQEERPIIETFGTSKNRQENKISEEIKSRKNGREKASIKKCLIQGRTIYSDTECQNSENVKSVEMHDTQGFITKTTQAIPRQIETQQPQPQIATLEKRKQENCEEVKARIEFLDSWARQPLSGQQQDAIREERRKLDSLKC